MYGTRKAICGRFSPVHWSWAHPCSPFVIWCCLSFSSCLDVSPLPVMHLFASELRTTLKYIQWVLLIHSICGCQVCGCRASEHLPDMAGSCMCLRTPPWCCQTYQHEPKVISSHVHKAVCDLHRAWHSLQVSICPCNCHYPWNSVSERSWNGFPHGYWGPTV